MSLRTLSRKTRLAWALTCLLVAPAAHSQIFIGVSAEGVPVLSSSQNELAPELLIDAPRHSASGAMQFTGEPTGIHGATEPGRGGGSAQVPVQLHRIIHSAAREHGIPAPLIAAVMATESAFDANAVSRKGATGLMQLMPQTARRFSAKNILSPEDNTRAGAAYLRWLMDRFGNRIDLVLAAYNAGEGAVDRAGGIPRYAETQAYVPKVLRYLRHFEQTGQFSSS
jgi:hypothetical protein